MKAKDIKPGVVYARKKSFGPPEPIVFLATDKDHRYRDGYRGFKSSQDHPWFERTCRYGYYPVVAVGWLDPKLRTQESRTSSDGRTEEQMLAALTSATLADFEAATNPNDSRRGINFDLVKSLGTIAGTYADAMTEYREGRRRQDQAEAEARQRREARDAETKALQERAEALDLHLGYTNEAGSFVVPRATVVKLLDKIDELEQIISGYQALYEGER